MQFGSLCAVKKHNDRIGSGESRKRLIRFVPRSAARPPLISSPIANRGDRGERDDSRGDSRYYIIIRTSMRSPLRMLLRGKYYIPIDCVARVLPVFRRIKSGITRPGRAVHRSNECIVGYKLGLCERKK